MFFVSSSLLSMVRYLHSSPIIAPIPFPCDLCVWGASVFLQNIPRQASRAVFRGWRTRVDFWVPMFSSHQCLRHVPVTGSEPSAPLAIGERRCSGEQSVLRRTVDIENSTLIFPFYVTPGERLAPSGQGPLKGKVFLFSFCPCFALRSLSFILCQSTTGYSMSVAHLALTLRSPQRKGCAIPRPSNPQKIFAADRDQNWPLKRQE